MRRVFAHRHTVTRRREGSGSGAISRGRLASELITTSVWKFRTYFSSGSFMAKTFRPCVRRSSSRRPRRLVELVLSWYVLLAHPLSRREGGTCLLWTSGSQSAAGTHRSIEVLTANKSTCTCSTSAPTSLVGCLVQLGVVRSRQTARQELQVRAEPPHPPSPHSLIDPGGTGCPP